MTELVPASSRLAVSIPMSEHATFDPQVGLILADDITKEELANAIRGFDMFQDASCFGVGDAANAYKRLYPEDWRQWMDSMPKQDKLKGNLDQSTVAAYANVCAKFDHDFIRQFRTAENGRRVLSFGHFARVRRFGPEEAAAYLEHAAVHDLSIEQMGNVIDAGTPAQDVIPPVPAEPTAQYATIYELPGGHRLLCGDSTNPVHVTALFQSDVYGATPGYLQADMIWTDPPYGVEYESKVGVALGGAALPSHTGAEQMTIDGDSQADLGLLLDAWRAATAHVKPTTPFYVAGPTGDNIITFLQSFQQAGWTFEQMLIWRKHRMTPGRSDYHNHHESIFYGRTQGPSTSRMTLKSYPDRLRRWHGGDDATTIFDVKRPASSLDHPTMKPVALITPMILNSAPPGGIVFDPFAGSGSTLIAAHQTGRRAFLIEKDRAYADVIRTRFEDYLAETERTAREQQTRAAQQARASDIEAYGPTALDPA